MLQTDRAARLLMGTRIGIADLRQVTDPGSLLRAAAVATVDRCGFDRCIAFIVDGSELVGHSVYFGTHEEWAQQTLVAGQSAEGRPPLRPGLVETEMVRRRTAALVSDAQNDPNTPRALVAVTQTQSYVAAPVVCEDRVVAFLHVDRHFAAVAVDEVDREGLGAFAAGVGLALERLTLQRHLALQQQRCFDAANDLQRTVASMTIVDVGFADVYPNNEGRVRNVAHAPSVHARLSSREREVLDLMVSGASNGEIARRLVITEGTAKTHVHHILKKLNATNRAEAVGIWLSQGS